MHFEEIIFSLHRASSVTGTLPQGCNYLFIVDQQQIFVIFCFFFRGGRILKGRFLGNLLFFGFLLGFGSKVFLKFAFSGFERSLILMLISFLKITSLTACSTISSSRSLSRLMNPIMHIYGYMDIGCIYILNEI